MGKHLNVERNPALKLLEFYQTMASGEGDVDAKLGMEKTESRSEVMRGLGGVKGEWMGLWLGQWSFWCALG
jgi:hypothetical protein